MRIKKIYPSAVNDDFHRHDDIEEPTELGSQYHTDPVCGMKIHQTEKYVKYDGGLWKVRISHMAREHLLVTH